MKPFATKLFVRDTFVFWFLSILVVIFLSILLRFLAWQELGTLKGWTAPWLAFVSFTGMCLAGLLYSASRSIRMTLSDVKMALYAAVATGLLVSLGIFIVFEWLNVSLLNKQGNLFRFYLFHSFFCFAFPFLRKKFYQKMLQVSVVSMEFRRFEELDEQILEEELDDLQENKRYRIGNIAGTVLLLFPIFVLGFIYVEGEKVEEEGNWLLFTQLLMLFLLVVFPSILASVMFFIKRSAAKRLLFPFISILISMVVIALIPFLLVLTDNAEQGLERFVSMISMAVLGYTIGIVRLFLVR